MEWAQNDYCAENFYPHKKVQVAPKTDDLSFIAWYMY